MVVSELITMLGFKTDEAGKKKAEGSIKELAQKAKHILETIGAIEIGKSILETAGAWQQAQVAFQGMLGSAQQASEMMHQLDEFAAKSPFRRDDVFQYAKGLLANGFAAAEITPLMKKLGDITSVVGTQAMPTMVMGMERIKQRGVADMMSLRSMMSAGVPIIQQLASQYGVTTIQMYQMIQQGRVGFAQVNQALTALTSGSGKFAGMMAKEAQTLPGLWKQIKYRVEDVETSIGAALIPTLQKGLGWFIKFWDANKDQVIKAVIKGIGYVAVTIAYAIYLIREAYRVTQPFLKLLWNLKSVLIPIGLGFMGVLAAVRLVNGAVAIAKDVQAAWTAATKVATVVQGIFNAVLDANPVALIIIGVIALIAIIVLAVTHWKQISAWISRTWDVIKKFAVGLFHEVFPYIRAFGQMLLKWWLTPLNLVIDAIRGLLLAMSKIPVVGGPFKTALEAVTSIQNKGNALLTGSANQFGYGETMRNAGVKIPGHSTGLNYVPRDMIARIHQGEAIIPANHNRGGAVANVTVNLTVPAGTSHGQADYVRNVARQEFHAEMLKLLRANGTALSPQGG